MALSATQVAGGSHLTHIVTSIVFMVVVLGGVALSDLFKSRRPSIRQTMATRVGYRSPFALCAAAMTLAAGIVHASVVRAHFHESLLYGGFFITTAGVQVTLALLVAYQPSPRYLRLAFVANASLVALWAQTRIVAVPIGPSAGVRERIGLPDALATGFEFGAIVMTGLVMARALDLLREPARLDVRRRYGS